MNKTGLLERIKEDKARLLYEHDKHIEMIKCVPDSVTSITHVSCGNVFYLEDADTLEDLKEQLLQWDKLKPEIDSYFIFDGCGRSLCVKFILANGNHLSTYCKEVEKALEYYSGGNCIIEKTEAVSEKLKCMVEGE